MEITLTVHLPRRRPQPVDVVVEWSGRSTAAELCAALSTHLGEPVPGLTSRGRAVADDSLVGMPPLLHGASVAVTSAASHTGGGPAPPATGPAGLLDLVVVGGPDAGRSHPLVPPGLHLGRAVDDGLVVADESLSRCHLFVGVGPSGVSVEDCGSTNGVAVDGVRVHGMTTVDAGSTVVAGATTLRVRRTGGPGAPAALLGDGTVRIAPGVGPPASTDDIEVHGPAAPAERHRARIPWVAALVPVPVAVALAFLLGPQLLLFAVLGPLTLLGSAVGDRWGSGRARRRDLVGHAAAVAGARTRLAEALSAERERLDRAHPDPATVLATAEQHRSGLWRGGGAAMVRLGLGDVPTRVVWVDGSTRARPTAAHSPFVVDLRSMPCLGVVGPPSATDGVLANLVGQLCTTSSPDELTVSVLSSDPGWAWSRRLPHAAEPAGVASPAVSRGSSGVLRVVVIPEPGPDTAGLVRRAREAGALVLAAASTRAGLPPGCDAMVVEADGEHVLEGTTDAQGFVLDRVGAWWSDRLSRALAPLRCSEQVAGARMPSRLALADALGGVEVTSASVADRWRAGRGATGAGAGSTPTPRAVVGRTTEGAFVIDLVRDGPHVLVGGTTGSGKSEFLRTLVTSLALSSPPDELAFVLVDFKGGAAFGPCAALPHVVGLVTDLDDHLVARALASLRAELRRRERLFAEVGAGDLEGYQRARRPDSEPVPRLVVVVDELRALVEELPDFVSGLVRLAALGRSLGVHLVLATQRPSGAVSAEIQANVSLRIAFRMRDRSDSLDVLDDDAAAGTSPSTPGRALARGGDGVLVGFQAATTSEPPARSTTAIRVRPAPSGEEVPDDGPVGEGEIMRLVEAVQGAHGLTGGRRPAAPWLAPLPDLVPPARSGAGSRAARDVAAAGLVDEPDLQRVSPLTWRAADGSWLLSGPSGSGRTTALRAVVLGAAGALGPAALHVQVIDARGALADLGDLPHVGTRARPDDPRACTALVRHLRAEVDRRLDARSPGPPGGAGPASTPGAPSGEPVTLVVVDGWDHLVEAQPAHAPDELPGELLRVLRDGRAVGVVGVVSGGRSLLHPRWGAVAARTFLLGPIDSLDAALVGLRATDLPREPPPGRAVRVHDRREVQFVAATPADTALLATRSRPRPAVGDAWRLRTLPAAIRRHDVVHPVHQRADAGPHGVPRPGAVLIGVGGPSSAPWHWRPADDGRRLLVAGPSGSGRTNVLRVLAESLCAAGRFVAVVQPGTSPGGTRSWPEGVLVTGAEHPDPLIRARRDHPGLVLLVDDADRLGEAPAVAVLREIIGLVDRDDGLVVAATSSADMVTRFRGVDVELARHRAGLLLSPVAVDREVLGAAVPDGIPRLPGRGLLVSRGVSTEVQVLLAEGSAGRVTPGQHLGVGLLGREGREAGEQGHPDDDPADQHPVALDQAEADGQEQHVPDDGGGAWPGSHPEPPAGQGAQTGRSDQDQQGRHQHPGGVAALPQDELDDVVHGEPGQGQRLQPGEQRGEAAGAA